MSVNEIKKAIEHLSVEERLDLMQWLNQSTDDEWDSQMKRDAADGKFDKLIKEAEPDYKQGRTTEFPCPLAPRVTSGRVTRLCLFPPNNSPARNSLSGSRTRFIPP